jgi:hypothetical protein
MTTLLPKPVRPPYEITDKKSREKHWDEWEKYFDATAAWEKKSAPIGQKYEPSYIHSLVHKANCELWEWLKSNGAPEDLLILAANLVRLQYDYLVFSEYTKESNYTKTRFKAMPDGTAADLAFMARETGRALSRIRRKR